jgi:hypothetical protein
LLTLHGYCKLGEGYALARVYPARAIVLPREGHVDVADAGENLPSADDTEDLVAKHENVMQKYGEVSSNYNAAKLLLDLLQLVFVTTIVARNLATEILDNVYGSCSLTELQYAWMSGVNFVGLLINPVYSTLFLVESEP